MKLTRITIRTRPGRVLLLALGSLPWLSLQAADYQVQAGDSRLQFSGTVYDERFDGRFERFAGSIHFDPAQLQATRFDIQIDVTSVDTDSEERDELLANPEWFDFDGHPQARFTASGARIDGDGYLSEGRLLLRGIEQPASLRFRIGDDGRLRGSATLDRLQWSLGGEEWADEEVIARAVEVRVDVRLQAAGS